MKQFDQLKLDCSSRISKQLFPIMRLDWENSHETYKKYYLQSPGHLLNKWITKESEILCSGVALCNPILVGTTFDITFPALDVENYIVTEIVLKYASVNREYEIESIPNGYSAFCIIEFLDSMPHIFKQARNNNGGIDATKIGYYYLTQSQTIKRIINELS